MELRQIKFAVGRGSPIQGSAFRLAAAMACVAACLAGAATVADAQRGGQPSSEVERLRERVEQLEAQLLDMRVTLGTLQSLAKAPAGSDARSGAGNYGNGGGNSGRVGALETQVRALTAQIERLAGQVRALSGDRRGAVSPQPRPQFGETTVTPPGARGGDRIGSFIRRSQPPNSTDGGVQPDAGTGDPAAGRQQYEEAYSFWLQNNLIAARAAFTQFLRDHPRHELAGNATYWMGEIHFKEGRFNQAAKSFLKVTQSYASSRLAPDSFLRLAESLEKLGHKRAACSTLNELEQKSAPRGILRRAKSEKSRMGC